MPWLGFGTYKIPEGAATEDAVGTALDYGYRGIDTASLYGNEGGVGRAVRESGVPRDEVFVATKVWNDEQGYAETHQAFERSLKRLRMEYVDLYLIHWPVGRIVVDTWRAMEEILESGAARAIGVCNFLEHHLEQLRRTASVMPMVDQVEHHPRLAQPHLREYLRREGVVIQAWAPVMRGRAGATRELAVIGERHGKTAEQVSLRWILQHGVTAIPKSVHAARILENASVFDFELSEDEMAAIDALDRGERLGPDPDKYGWRG
ncbi:MAG: aldo/keto reductase [Coriobacteriia bacterium]|nr:aldo/keto reductase [Coriobacteriia bacterium]